MTRDEAIERLNIHKSTSVFVDSIAEAIDMAIEALSAEEAVWNEYEAEFTDLPDIPRYYYEKVVGKMAHEINMLKEQLESADAEQGEWIIHGEPPWLVRECSECGAKWHQWSGDKTPNYCGNCGARMEANE